MLVDDQKNINRNIVIKQPVDIQSLGNTPADLNILSTDKASVTALCFVYGIPVELYYGEAKYENAKESKKALYQLATIPLVNTFAEDLIDYAHRVNILSDKEDYNLVLNTDKIDTLQDTPAAVMTNLTSMHATLNELREALGYPRIEEAYADEPMLPIGTLFGSDMVDINETATNNAKE